jgi:hypothetical protein
LLIPFSSSSPGTNNLSFFFFLSIFQSTKNFSNLYLLYEHFYFRGNQYLICVFTLQICVHVTICRILKINHTFHIEIEGKYYILFSYQTGYTMWHSRLRIYIPWGCASGNILYIISRECHIIYPVW